MLTPAEELGLSGQALASRVHHALYRLGQDRLVHLVDDLRTEALTRHLVYFRSGEIEPIRVLPLPLTVLPDQIAYIHHVTLTVQNALKRLPRMYLDDPAVRHILQLPEAEERWLNECWGTSQEEHNSIFGRMDALIDFTNPMWKNSFHLVEPNLSGIGGLHIVPQSERLVAELVVPALRQQDPELDLQCGHDIRELLVQEILDHMKAIGSGQQLCLIEAKYAGDGPDEQDQLCRYFHDRHGLNVMHADPAELELYRGEVCYCGNRVDLGYRDYSVADLLELEEEGVSVEPMKQLLRENRLISSIAAELDQKSCWEVLTDPLLAQKYFSPDERLVFQRHVLWTRVVSDRRTVLPDGHLDELLDYIDRQQETLVLKPNRSYGGEGVVLGCAVSSSTWRDTIEAGVTEPGSWVAQQLATIPVREFPVLGPDGRLHAEPFYTVMGFAASEHGVSVLARASQKQVVNVAQHGGLAAVLVSRSTPAIGAATPALDLQLTWGEV
ncbi:MAG TPA: hypothetical protein VFZ90_08185 [Gemmatimonadales bacterium]